MGAVLSPKIISSKGTPNVIRGVMNLGHNNMFSSLLQSTEPKLNNQKEWSLFMMIEQLYKQGSRKVPYQVQ